MTDPRIAVESSTIAGAAVVGISVLLGMAGVAILAAARRRRCFIVFSVLAALPLVAGAIGTVIGYGEVGEAVAAMGAAGVEPQIVDAAFAQARLPLYIGAGGFAALLIVSLVGLLLCKDLCASKELRPTELIK